MAEVASGFPSRQCRTQKPRTQPHLGRSSPSISPTTLPRSESAWNAFLVEHGARWEGAESSWEQFKTWFLYQAEQRTLTTPGNGFITYVEGQSDKAAAFAQYGVAPAARASTTDGPAAPVDVSAFRVMKPGDSGEWVDYLDGGSAHFPAGAEALTNEQILAEWEKSTSLDDFKR